MKKTRTLLFIILGGLPLLLVAWLIRLYSIGCGGTLDCSGAAPPPERTPIPTLIPATLPVLQVGGGGQAVAIQCSLTAVDLLGAWVTASASESDPFDFTDVNGTLCQGTFSQDIIPLFRDANLWYDGALACASCHGSAASSAKLDLSSYAGILAGSQRASAEAKGNDILGGGNWEQSTLYEVLISRSMPPGRPADSPAKGPTVQAGKPK